MSLSLFNRPPARKRVELFDGTRCDFCALLIGGEHESVAVWGSSHWFDYEVECVGFNEMRESMGHIDATAVVIAAFRYEVYRSHEGEFDCDIELIDTRPVSLEAAFAHRSGRKPLWVDPEVPR